jgi:hypothetical protein
VLLISKLISTSYCKMPQNKGFGTGFNMHFMGVFQAIQEVRQHYMKLSQKQRDFIAVNTQDFFSRFVFEIGMIFNDDTSEFSERPDVVSASIV